MIRYETRNDGAWRYLRVPLNRDGSPPPDLRLTALEGAQELSAEGLQEDHLDQIANRRVRLHHNKVASRNHRLKDINGYNVRIRRKPGDSDLMAFGYSLASESTNDLPAEFVVAVPRVVERSRWRYAPAIFLTPVAVVWDIGARVIIVAAIPLYVTGLAEWP